MSLLFFALVSLISDCFFFFSFFCYFFFFFSYFFFFFFFFSSRRRHTRCGRDWSSDVCSSDLIAPSRKIDTFERTGTSFMGHIHYLFADTPVFLYNECITGLQLLHLTGANIECGLNNRSLRGHHHDFVVHIVGSGADPVGITHNKGIAMPKKSPNHIAPIPAATRTFQDFTDIQTLFDQCRDLPVAVTFILKLPEQQLILLI